MEQSRGTRQVKALSPGAAGIKEQDAIVFRDKPLVAMAEHEHPRAFGPEVVLHLLADLLGLRSLMPYITWHAGELEADLGGKDALEVRLVYIAQNGSGGGERAQTFDHCKVADIATMNDVVEAGESRAELWIEESVRIGHHTDFHVPVSHSLGRNKVAFDLS